VGKFGSSKSAKKGAASKGVGRGDGGVIWGLLAIVVVVSLAEAVFSPLLAWRQPVYIAAGFAGVLAMAFLLLQPLLAGGYLPGLRGARGRRVHRWFGSALVIAVVAHIGGLWITSPPDVVDVLLFRSPTPFALWGAIAMWAVFLTALIAALRQRWRLHPRIWRLAHTSLALITVIGSIIHAVLIEGTMEPASKVILCAAALAATAKVMVDLRVWAVRARSAGRR
jgi:predicted ferric reductase